MGHAQRDPAVERFFGGREHMEITGGFSTMCSDASGGMSKLLRRIQQHVVQRRIRTRNFFVDFDMHRAGACSVAQFQRSTNSMGLVLSPDEVNELAAQYRIPGAAPAVEFNYSAFCNDVDSAFGSPAKTTASSTFGNSMTPLQTPRMASTGTGLGVGTEGIDGILERLRTICKIRGVTIKACYEDFERTSRPVATRITPFQSGKITKSQFIRQFPFPDRFSQDEVQSLAEAFGTESGDVNYQALDTVASGGNKWDPVPIVTSGFTPRRDGTEWSQNTLSPMDKLRCKVVERRLRLVERFQDFDALRKGVCTGSQAKTVFSILDLTKALSREDVEAIVSAFSREDGMFDYRAFCSEADKDFTTPGLEQDPSLPIPHADASTTEAGRRNRPVIRSEGKLAEIEALLTRIASKVKTQRIFLTPLLKDMDKNRRGHVSVSQFTRVLLQLDLGLSEPEVKLLCANYCDCGNHRDFNYVDFVQKVDPPDEKLIHSQALQRTPRPSGTQTKYFTAYGRVRPLDQNSSATFAA